MDNQPHVSARRRRVTPPPRFSRGCDQHNDRGAATGRRVRDRLTSSNPSMSGSIASVTRASGASQSKNRHTGVRRLRCRLLPALTRECRRPGLLALSVLVVVEISLSTTSKAATATIPKRTSQPQNPHRPRAGRQVRPHRRGTEEQPAQHHPGPDHHQKGLNAAQALLCRRRLPFRARSTPDIRGRLHRLDEETFSWRGPGPIPTGSRSRGSCPERASEKGGSFLAGASAAEAFSLTLQLTMTFPGLLPGSVRSSIVSNIPRRSRRP